VPVPCCFYCYGSVVWFEVGYCDTSRNHFFLFLALSPSLLQKECEKVDIGQKLYSFSARSVTAFI
jgi:hypothetical protein